MSGIKLLCEGLAVNPLDVIALGLEHHIVPDNSLYNKQNDKRTAQTCVCAYMNNGCVVKGIMQDKESSINDIKRVLLIVQNATQPGTP